MNYDDWKATNPADEELGEPPCARCFLDGFSECRCETEEEPTAGNVLLTPDGQQTSLPGPPVGCPHCGHVHLGYSGCGMRLRGDAPAWCKCASPEPLELGAVERRSRHTSKDAQTVVAREDALAVVGECRRLNDDGSPTHPLYLAAALKPFPMPEAGNAR